jgi:hypothetical protein
MAETFVDPDAVVRTPDELLMELMDLVALAFPEPLAEMVITFLPSDDRSRPALTNLDGKAAPGQPKRPDLGHPDGAVLDAINALLVEFADATARQGGARVFDGHIRIVDGADGDRFVELRERAPGAGEGATELVMTRRFDRSELRWLFWTAPLYRRLEETEQEEAKQMRALDDALGRYRRFDIDMQRGTIVFTGPGQEPSTYAFQLLGSWSDETKNFLWGWANEQVPPSLIKQTDAVRLMSTDEGLRALHEGSFGCPEPCAARLARHAAVQMKALGTYRAPFTSSQGKGFMYLALLPSAAPAS